MSKDNLYEIKTEKYSDETATNGVQGALNMTRVLSFDTKAVSTDTRLPAMLVSKIIATKQSGWSK